MSRFQYYESLKSLAQRIRKAHNLTTPRILRSDLRRIYGEEGIRIDLWPHNFKKLRGAYFNDNLGPTVLLAKNLPPEPRIFTMGHELKHHLVDRKSPIFTDRAAALSFCSTSNGSDPVEIGAEIFAAELIFPEQDFINWMAGHNIKAGECTPETLVQMKRETRTTLSYAGLGKRTIHLKFSPDGAFVNVRWKSLEERIYGESVYKRILRYRATSRRVTS